MGGRGSGAGESDHGSVREEFHKGERILISKMSVNGRMKDEGERMIACGNHPSSVILHPLLHHQ
jgi:hypothetical protein